MIGMAATNSAAKNATKAAAYAFGVHCHLMFEPTTAPAARNCAIFNKVCIP